MSDLLHIAWQDLREKRLWPIAAALAIALVAIPALLTKSAAQPSSVDSVATAPVPDRDEQVRVALDGGGAASTGAGSSLDKFAEGDPFTPPGAIANNSETGGAATSPSSEADAGETHSGGADPGGGGVGSPPSPPGVPVDVNPPTTRTETAQYEYVADVTFRTGDRRRNVRGLHKLDMLPNQSAPVLIFMGTSGDGGNAVFLVDSTLKAAGEGRCVPSPANCAYVHLGPGSEHEFTTVEGDSYRLRIEEIRRVEVEASGARDARPSARTSVGNRAASRRFELPSLIDLVAVTETTTTPGSSVPADGR